MKYLRSFSSLRLNHSRRVVVRYKGKIVHKVLVNCLFKHYKRGRKWIFQKSVNLFPNLEGFT